MKKYFIKTTAFCIAALLCATMAACGRHGDDSGRHDIKIDESMAQLYVYNFGGGYGSAWLDAAKARFESEHSGDEFTDGAGKKKKGVQIVYINQKTYDLDTRLKANQEEIYFGESVNYYMLKNMGALGDITEAVTSPLTEYGENKSIEDKMTDEQKNYLKIDGRYYAVPHYSGFTGLIYNVDLFDEQCWYFAKEKSGKNLEDNFIADINEERSTGPDGVYGTFDDGLPATYDEFFTLCDYIKQNATPVIWNGLARGDYFAAFAVDLATDFEGVEQMMLNYTLSGTADSLLNDKSERETLEINDDNGYELARQEGILRSLEFCEKLIKDENYRQEGAFKGSYSHIMAQADFLNAGHDGYTPDAAMLLDGVWWEMEAADMFDTMVRETGNENFDKHHRRFGFMPLPKANEAKVREAAAAPADGKYCIYDHMDSLCFLKSNTEEWKKPLALDFIRFVNTDRSLCEFTAITDTLKALNYTMSEEDMAKLTYYGKSLMQYKNAARVIYPHSVNPKYLNNFTFFGYIDSYSALLDGSECKYFTTAFHEQNTTAEEYFKGIRAYRRRRWN